ncbi:MAG: molecular chaperone DnaJ, partial [Eubacterium sp.]|nr:molecular chaperone DnaJ [Eubacterium sp.]
YVKESSEFQRHGYDIYSVVKISYPRAALGGDIVVHTIDGDVAYNVKAGTQTGTRVRLRGKGVPSLRNKKMRGDHFIDLVVEVPTSLSRDQKKLLEQLDESFEGKHKKKKK